MASADKQSFARVPAAIAAGRLRQPSSIEQSPGLILPVGRGGAIHFLAQAFEQFRINTIDQIGLDALLQIPSGALLDAGGQ